ncbi:unnamed protein product [Litomosoides sigmodontis]|uniref:Uncharacterized protein n=1 Tax=Litomosoides sigmodontis TaxID=42156 RepID=A0A3P6TUE9_LITSI|nr:unnamed protein product [Litomosoides sigmodontis]
MLTISIIIILMCSTGIFAHSRNRLIMPNRRTSMGQLHRIFRKKSASFTKIELDGEKNGEDDSDARSAASGSRTWTNAMGRSLRKRLSAFRKDSSESESFAISKSVSERVNVIQLRNPSNAVR